VPPGCSGWRCPFKLRAVLKRLLGWLPRGLRPAGARGVPIPDALWQRTLQDFAFLPAQPPALARRLRSMSAEFLADKEFFGAHGLQVTDAMAVAIAAQACLPVLHLGLHWYDDFKGIVVHPGAMLARREVTDEAGVVHRYTEELSGEAMEMGPVTLSWADVAASGESAPEGYNVVIHEFVHKLDMRNGQADGCPPLPTRALRQRWQSTMQESYARFCTQVTMADRFGAPAPWLDAYAASAPAEFFAVASEAYFVNPGRFAESFPELLPLLNGFFKPET
jgi:Mlc titration factor MtfA (ptsG expression regulator)